MRFAQRHKFLQFFAGLTILSFTFTQAVPAWALRPREPEPGTPAHTGLEENLTRTIAVSPPAMPGQPLQDFIEQLQLDPVWRSRSPMLGSLSGWSFRAIFELFMKYQAQIMARKEEWPVIMASLLAPGDYRAQKVLGSLKLQTPAESTHPEVPWHCNACVAYASAHQLVPVTNEKVEVLQDMRQLVASFLIARQGIQRGQVNISPTGEPVHSLLDIRELLAGYVPVHSIQFDGQRRVEQLLLTLERVGGWALLFVQRRLPDGGTMLHAANVFLDEGAKPVTIQTQDGKMREIRASIMDNDELISLSDFFKDNTFLGQAVFTQGTLHQVEAAAAETGFFHRMSREEEAKTEACCGIIGVRALECPRGSFCRRTRPRLSWA